MKTASRLALLLLCGIGIFFPGMAAAVFPTLYLKPVVLDQLHAPTTILGANDGSGRVFVCDQPGRIYIIKNGMMLPTPFLDISNTAANVAHRKVLGLGTGYDERGLLGMAFHPGYDDPLSPGYRKFYLNYNKTYQAGIDPPPPNGGDPTNCTTVVAEFQATANPDIADPLSERKILLFTQPQSNHNGGGLVFGTDNMLYIASGDGGNSQDNNVGHTGGTAAKPTNSLGNSQDKTNYLGKILRIDPFDPDGAGPLTYAIPSDNPFFNDTLPAGLKKEIYAYGIRNPWGFCFDNRPGGTGRFFSADVGQGRVEEINLIVSGGNYGWRYLEGTEMPSFSSGSPTNPMPHPGGALIGPISQYAHPGANVADPSNPPNFLPQLGLSITGGFVYRGSAIPALQGKYVFGDYGATSGSASGRMMGLEETAPLSGVFTLTQALPLVQPNPLPLRILCMGEDDDGELYVGGKVSGGVQALQTGMPNGCIYKILPVPPVVSTTTLNPVKDNSVFGEYGPMGEELSNGTGNLFAGRTSGGSPSNRRALLLFDVTSVPAGSAIVNAALQLTVNAVDAGNPGARTFNVFKLRESWGEAGSFSSTGGAIALDGDATFDSRFYSATTPVLWTYATDMPFWASTSAFASLNGVGNYTWSYQLYGDVRAWLANPASNLGWILVGDETVTGTAKKLDSRESASSAVRPQLAITHVPPSNYEAWLAAYFLSSPVGAFIDPEGDLDGDGIKNQIEYAYAFSPHSYNAPGSDGFTTALAPAGGGATDFTITFRRDSNAADLTYSLQTSSDLINWTTIAQSTGGAAATGQNGGTVLSDIVLSGSIRIVTVLQTLAAGSNEKKFVRLRVDRVF